MAWITRTSLWSVQKVVAGNSTGRHLRNMLKLVNWFLCQKERNSTLRLKDSLLKNRYFFIHFKAALIKQNKLQ
jgi:hypothetical protein